MVPGKGVTLCKAKSIPKLQKIDSGFAKGAGKGASRVQTSCCKGGSKLCLVLLLKA